MSYPYDRSSYAGCDESDSANCHRVYELHHGMLGCRPDRHPPCHAWALDEWRPKVDHTGPRYWVHGIGCFVP